MALTLRCIVVVVKEMQPLAHTHTHTHTQLTTHLIEREPLWSCQAERKKREKYERKLAQARAMINRKCDVYSKADAITSPPMPGESLNKHNRLHFKHDLDSPVAVGALPQERNRLHTRHLPGEKVAAKEKRQPDVIFVNGISYVNSAFERDALSPISPSLNDSALFDDDEDVPGLSLAPTRRASKSSQGKETLFPWPSQSGENAGVNEALLGESAGYESPKARKKREKFERELAKARAQVARLPGYNGTTPPPRSVTPGSAKSTPPPQR